MPTHDTVYDFIAARFRQLGGKPLAIDDLLLDAEQDGYLDIWEMPRNGLYQALKARGIAIANGVAQFPGGEGENYDPVATDYAEFRTAAMAVLKDAEYPVPTTDLIERVGLHASAIPMASMGVHMRAIGGHFIPGMGYWRKPQFTNPDGSIVSRRIKSERVRAMLELFENQGYPIAGPDAERWTNGLVTPQWLAHHAYGESAMLRSVGNGLYVPADRDQREHGPIPMSRNVVLALLQIDETVQIDDKDHTRLFRIVHLVERLEWATVSRSRTTRAHQRRQTMRVTWSEKGLAALKRYARLTADAF